MPHTDMRGVATASRTLKYAREHVEELRAQVYADIADALPAPPPLGLRLEPDDRQTQRDLVDLTGWTRVRLRQIQDAVCDAREAKGEPLTARTPKEARAALSYEVKQLADADAAETAARAKLGDAILRVAPYLPGKRPRGMSALYEELTEITGYSPRQIDRMRVDAAERLARKTTKEAR